MGICVKTRQEMPNNHKAGNFLVKKFNFIRAVLPKSALGLAIFSLSSINVYATDNQSGVKSATSLLMEEVLVTAQKKGQAEGLQDVPLAITAHTGEQLEALFVESLIDIGHLSPNVSFDVNQSTQGFQSFFIRGTGLSSSTLSTDPAVGVFIDGMYLGLPAAVVMDTFDLESVEVLRGPQGTLFGRNVTGGAVSIKSRRPSEEFGMRARAIGGSDERYELALSVTGGLTDNVAGKVTLFYKDQGHTYDNVAKGTAFAPDADDVGGREMKVVRPSLSIEFNNDINLLLLGEIGELTHSVGARQLVDNSDPIVGIVKSIPGLPFPTNNDVSLEYTPETETDWYHLIAEMNWQLGEGTLMSITTYREFEQNWASDADGSALWIFRSGEDSFIEQDQFSQEFVYNLAVNKKVDLTTGLYYFDQSYRSLESRFFGTISSASDFGDATVDHKTYGIFAQADIVIFDDVVVTVGGRYTKEEKEAEIAQLGGDCPTGFSSCVPSINDDDDWSNFSPKVAVKWEFNKDSQAYLSYTKGFRSGGYNIRSTNDVFIYDEEEIDAYELGLKTEWADGRMRLNAAFFYNEVQDMQRNVNIPGGVGGAQALLNAAEATIHGIEVEGAIAVMENLYISYTLGWMDAEYDEYANLDVDGDMVPDPALAKDLDLPRIPEWTGGLAATYELPVAIGSLVMRADFSYTANQFFDDRNLLEGSQYELYNASVAYIPDNANWKVTLFGKNLTDKRYYTGGFETSFWDFWDLGARRSWGVEFSIEM